MNTSNDSVVVLLLNYNQNDYTLKCVKSLLKSDYHDFKIFLLDNGSTKENVTELIQKLPKSDKLVFHPLDENIGYAKGTNFAMEFAKRFDPKYYLIMNNDTIIDEKAISELVKTCKKYNDRARVTGKVYHYDDPNRIQFIAFEKVVGANYVYQRMGNDEVDEGQYDNLEELEMMDDIFVLQPVSLYDTIGGYSPYLWVNGVNIDISLRAMKTGYKLAFNPEAKLWHKGSISIGGRNMNPKLAYFNIQSKLTLRYLHLDKIRFIKYYLNVVFTDVLRTSFKAVYLKLFKGEDIFKYAGAKLQAVFDFNKWVFKKNHNMGYNPY